MSNYVDTFKPQRRAAVNITLTTSSVAINILMLALPVCIMLVYDRVLVNQATETLAVLIVGLSVAALTELALRLLRSRLLNTSSLVAEHHNTMAAVDKILYADPLKAQQLSVGDHLERLRSIERIREYHSGGAEHVRVDLAFALINLLLIWFIAGPLVAVPIAVIAVVGCTVWWLSLSLKKFLLQRVKLENQRHDFLAETMSSIHAVRALAVESLPTRVYEHIQGKLDKNLHDGASVQGLIQGIGVLGSQMVLVLFVGIGAYSVLAGELTLGALAAGTMLSGRVLQPLLASVSAWLTHQRILLAMRAVSELLQLPVAAQPQPLQESDPQTPAAAAPPRDASAARVELDGVAFAYRKDLANLFEHVYLQIEPRETIGIVANNGSGKSTFMQLLLGLYQPSAGQVLIDGQPACLAKPGDFALLPQRGALFKGTLGQNLSFFKGASALREAVRIADKLGLMETIKKLPQGLDTPINGGQAAPLSSSVKQQILIARNLVGRPRLLLVDEASTTLDPQSDRAFQSVISEIRGRTTIVMATNRGSLLSTCDRVLKIDQRRLVDVTADYRGRKA